MNELRNGIAKTIAKWCFANDEEFFPNPLADKIVEYLRTNSPSNLPKATASHAVLSEMREKLEKRVVYIEKDIEYHDEYVLFNDVMKILSEHFR